MRVLRVAFVVILFLINSFCLCSENIPSANNSNAADDHDGLIFDTATVKPSDPRARSWRMEFTVDGFAAQNVSLQTMIQEAFDAYQGGRIVGGAPWIDKEKFDVQAKFDASQVANYKKLSYQQRRVMLQELLARRFRLKAHFEQRQIAVYSLTLDKKAATFLGKPTQRTYSSDATGDTALIKQSDYGYLDVANATTLDLCHLLDPYAKRVVIDHTNLTGRYDFTLHWTPDDAPPPAFRNPADANAETTNTWPSLYTALREQLGLRLETAQGPVQVLVIEDAGRPTAN